MHNALPLGVREEDNIEKFKQKVKILLFEGTAKFLEHAFIATWLYMITAQLSSSMLHSETALCKYDIIIIIIIIIVISISESNI